MFETILRRALYVGIFLIPFIPFYVAHELFFPFISGKNFAFRIIVEFLIAGWAILMLLDAKYRPKFSWIAAALTLFVGWMFIADLNAVNTSKAFWSNFERMEGWATLIHLLGYFLVTSSVLQTEKLWTRLINTSIGASAIMGIYGLVQLAGYLEIHQGGARVDGTTGNATYLAVYMLFHIFLTALMLLRWRFPENGKSGAMWGVWLYIGALALQLFILFNTATRGAILGVLGGILLAALIAAYFKRDAKAVRYSAIGIFITVVVLIGGLGMAKNTAIVQKNEVLTRFDFSGTNIMHGLQTLTLTADCSEINEKTLRSRCMVWGMAAQGVAEKPFLGWGQGNFNFVFNKYYNPLMYDQEPWFDRAHSALLWDRAVSGGIPGLLLYLALFGSALVYVWLPRTGLTRTEQAVFTGLLAAYGFHNLFVFDNLISYWLFATVLGYLHYRGGTKIERGWYQHEFDRKLVQNVAAPVVLIIAVGTVYIVNVPSIRAGGTLIDAMNAEARGNYEKSLQLYNEALAINAPVGTQEIRERLTKSASNMASRTQNPQIRRKFFQRAEEEIAAHINNIAPRDVRLWAYLGQLYASYNLPEEAIGAFKNAREFSPGKQMFAMRIGLIHLTEERYEEAIEIFREDAFKVTPNYDQARIYYATAAVYTDRLELAKRLLEEKFGTAGVYNTNLLTAYAEKGHAELVQKVRENRLKELGEMLAEANTETRRQQVVQEHFTLAARLYQFGMQEDALAVLRTITERIPGAAKQANYYIQEIEAGRRP